MLQKRSRRRISHRKLRMKIVGDSNRPRLCVFKSGKHIYAQLIDDQHGNVLMAVSDLGVKKGNKSNHSLEVGKMIARKALAKKIEKVVFDRGGFTFHGRVKKVAEGARQGGLKF